jgi:pimeloyl-ACP methyl ester carboxylesterase
MGIIFGTYAKRRFTVPALVLVGAMDPSGALQKMGHRRGLGGNVTTEVLPGEGHFIIDHRPEAVADRALRFLAREQGRAAPVNG